MKHQDIVKQIPFMSKIPQFGLNIEPSTRYFKPDTVEYLTLGEAIDQKLSIDPRVQYKLNNFGHRSEDFVHLDKDKTNILFAGCSSTFGIGLPEKYIWTQKIYDSIKTESLGPFQSITIPGGGPENIIDNIMKYCRNFGNPNYILVAFSDYSREVVYDIDLKRFIPKMNIDYNTGNTKCSVEEQFKLLYRFQLLYRILETFCLEAGITLISNSWDSATQEIGLALFSQSFIKSHTNLQDYIYSFDMDSIPKDDKDLMSIARDGHHPGIIAQSRMADSFLSSKQLDIKS